MTYGQAKTIIRWAASQMGLADWTIRLGVHPGPNDDGHQGNCEADLTRHVATVQIWPFMAAKDSENPVEVLFHELGHVQLVAAGLSLDEQGPHVEYMLNCNARGWRMAWEVARRKR